MDCRASGRSAARAPGFFPRSVAIANRVRAWRARGAAQWLGQAGGNSGGEGWHALRWTPGGACGMAVRDSVAGRFRPGGPRGVPPVGEVPFPRRRTAWLRARQGAIGAI
ncbi:hypothetical protein M758_2G041100 [Ceratodon purpureus]|uniref:Uncharacterized protein n=1 Tax=Ceratodon purpureus TaxID=3225 RepID=A0A8T0IT41_CERPU|nr:hypothetical protein KC19_2G041500 [Ceratodon purpureus]KAG0585818.1 hypothetical protein KC19_2G041800 [Ceratodon purpureus]KAG0625259.1 hypothetical protein M758_2G040800 [Ceratodon purpureus]KAG0625263.1 hypothetical protein M758_2G041100 [Ceratodon purpureus]